MRKYLLTPIVLLISCSPNTKHKLQFKNRIWVNQDLKFDTIYADSDSSIYSIYGSGTLLLLDSTYTTKSFSNMFISSNDSIAWGEPGIIVRKGYWQVKGGNIITTTKLINRTFISPTDTINKPITDSYHISGDTLIESKGERFVPVKLLTKELSTYLHSNFKQ